MSAWSVWDTGQLQAGTQRRHRYRPESIDHPAKMLPAIARYVISTYTRPGQSVLDPMCGIGTTLVESAHLGRHGVGIELEESWATTAQTNLDHALACGAHGSGEVHIGDAQQVVPKLASTVEDRAALLLTSPPYGAMTHGRVRSRRDGATKIAKWSHRYSQTRNTANLAYQKPTQLPTSFAAILAASRTLLEPGAHVVITTRPYRSQGRLVDFPGTIASAAEEAGLVLVDRCVALLCALRADHLVTRASFFQMVETAKLRAHGWPAHIIAHEDVFVLVNPPATTSAGSQESPRAGRDRDGCPQESTTGPDAGAPRHSRERVPATEHCTAAEPARREE
ncbi:putative RNA methylase [Lipingzhangella halophila]|uniref:Methyltransferase n=1 Tax=Lipingzhangella halophila TaxID=1783352 RepID=A0A7W7W517_9ACTN|nr:DNA methyltransferase [Lipingzhangella halophila]MBB4934381.1 putative RNA methylase [Lipingzhangella halophila]